VRHAANQGYGAAVTSGLRAARGELIFFTDSDGQFSFLDLLPFLIESRRCDVVIGYRYSRAEGGVRRFNAAAWNLLIRFLLGVQVRDLDCAYKLFRREVIDSIQLTAQGAAISVEIAVQATRGRWRVSELPVAHFPRYHGAPTGAALKVVARAFGELPQLWRYRGHVPIAADSGKATTVKGPGRNGRMVVSQNGDRRPNRAGEVPLKICMLAACPFPANHGTPGSIREMAEAISDRGHAVHLVTYHMGEEIPVSGPRVHRIASLTAERGVVVGPTVRRPLYDLQMVIKAIDVIHRHHADLIHSHGYEGALIAWLARMATGVPIVSSAHNTMSDELPSYGFIRPRWVARVLSAILDAFVPRIADRTIPHSANIERFYAARGLQARIEPVIYKGIKIEQLGAVDGNRVRQQYGLARGRTVLYAGVMNEFQRLDLLLEAMAQVTWYEPRARLLMVVTIPSPRHECALRQAAGRLGVSDKVIFTSPQALGRLPEFLAACDIAVVPRPKSPGFPIKILNYMAARRPCILYASSAGGLTHRENAYLVDGDSAEALGASILELLRDSDLRERIAVNGFDFVRRFRDRRLTARDVCAAYRRALDCVHHDVGSCPERDIVPWRRAYSSDRSPPLRLGASFTDTDKSAEILCEARIEQTA
jgi:glycosyltransferase involved in cell wall biosynthesis